jgi:hypothetical protein
MAEGVSKFAEQGRRYFETTWRNARRRVEESPRRAPAGRRRPRHGVIRVTVEV